MHVRWPDARRTPRPLAQGRHRMNKIRLLDKYPVYVEELAKSDTACVSTEEITDRLCTQLEARPGTLLIGVFDHYGHVGAQPDGAIGAGIRDSKHVIFCMSSAIPDPLIPAVRPRVISVVELGDRFVISFLEAPVEAPNRLMAGWVEALRRA